MAFKVFITEIANDDLAELIQFIARDNHSAAERFGFALIEKLKILQDHPRLGRVVPERGYSHLRELIHPPYRIVYRILESEGMVEVLRFWHGARGKLKLSND